MPRVLSIVLPCYNEEIALERLLPRLEDISSKIEEKVRILVVDDGSEDDTHRAASEWESPALEVDTLRFGENRGYGAALEEGIMASVRSLSEADLVATMDADDTHSPAYLVDMIRSLDDRNLDAVIASRYAPGGKEEGVPWDRRFLSRGASFLYRRVFDLPAVSDYSCGYRLFRASLIKKALKSRNQLDLGSGFHASGKLLLRLREQTDKIGEVPFELHYERKPTGSKMRKIRTVLGTLNFLREVRKTVRRL